MRNVELTLTIRGTATSDKGAVIRRRSAAEGSPFKDPALELSECTQLYLFRSPQGWSEGRLETDENRAKILRRNEQRLKLQLVSRRRSGWVRQQKCNAIDCLG